jgi:hypothetical protein
LILLRAVNRGSILEKFGVILEGAKGDQVVLVRNEGLYELAISQ